VLKLTGDQLSLAYVTKKAKYKKYIMKRTCGKGLDLEIVMF